jgi:hypothetical protein
VAHNNVVRTRLCPSVAATPSPRRAVRSNRITPTQDSTMPQNLAFGSTGDEVAGLQAALNSVSPSRLRRLKMDGIFGPRTLERVKEFQANSGLQADGIVGPLTWGTLESSLVPITPEEFNELWGYAYLLLRTEVRAGSKALAFFQRQQSRAALLAFPVAGRVSVGGPSGQSPVLASTLVLIGVGVLLLAAFVLACLIVLAQQRNAPAPDIAKLEREFEQRMIELEHEITTAPIKLILLIALMVQTIESIVRQRIKALEEQMEKCRKDSGKNPKDCQKQMDKILQQISHIKRQLTNLPFDTPQQRKLTLMGLAKSFGFLMLLISDWGRCMGCTALIFF